MWTVEVNARETTRKKRYYLGRSKILNENCPSWQCQPKKCWDWVKISRLFSLDFILCLFLSHISLCLFSCRCYRWLFFIHFLWRYQLLRSIFDTHLFTEEKEKTQMWSEWGSEVSVYNNNNIWLCTLTYELNLNSIFRRRNQVIRYEEEKSWTKTTHFFPSL